jgi:capsular exopolysaccharide synthesis family protein
VLTRTPALTWLVGGLCGPSSRMSLADAIHYRRKRMTTEFGADQALRTYLMVVRRRAWWIACVALLGLATSIGLALTEPKQYSATAQLLVQPSGTSTALGNAPAAVTPTDVQTDLQLVTSAPVQHAVSDHLGSRPTVSAAEVAQTNIIAISAVSPTPARAALIANTFARAFVSYEQRVAIEALSLAEGQLRTQIRSLGRQIASLKGQTSVSSESAALLNQEAVQKEQLAQMQVDGAVTTGGVEFVTPAQPPVSPSSPKPVQDGALGLTVGLILGLAGAFIRDSFDDTLTTKEATERLGGSPVLAMVPMVPSWKRREQPLVVSISQPLSPAAEAYRSLRTSLQFIRQERELRTILVTSPAATEGKTSTIANLGAVFAQAGERVLLVSCDLRRPRLGKFFGLDEQTGLTSVLLGHRQLGAVVQRVNDTMWVLGAGAVPSNPAELLSGKEMRQLFAVLRTKFDLVLIDSPPVLPVTDAAVLSNYVDGTLLVIAAGQTRRVELQRAAEKLAQVNAPVVGMVLNEVTRQSGYGYGYGYGYMADAEVPLARVPVPAPGRGPAAASTGSRHGRRGALLPYSMGDSSDRSD